MMRIRYRLIVLMSLVSLLTGCLSDTKLEMTAKLGPLAILIDHTGEVNIRVGQEWTLPTSIGSLSVGVNYDSERAKYRGLLILRSPTEELAWGLHDEREFNIEFGVDNSYTVTGIKRTKGEFIISVKPNGNAPSLRDLNQETEGAANQTGAEDNPTPLNMASCPDLPNLTVEIYATVSTAYQTKVYVTDDTTAEQIDVLSNGTAVCLRGRSADSRWYMLSIGRWVMAEHIYLNATQNPAILPVF